MAKYKNTLQKLSLVHCALLCSDTVHDARVDEALLVELAVLLKIRYNKHCTIVNMGCVSKWADTNTLILLFINTAELKHLIFMHFKVIQIDFFWGGVG